MTRYSDIVKYITMILFTINPTHTEPIYRQIVRQVHDAVVAGHLKPGDKLPSHRALATKLVINHLTVKRAYECLEQEGLTEKRRGLGSFIRPGRDAALAKTRRGELKRQLKALLSTAPYLGYDPDDVKKMVEECWPEREGTP